MDPHGRCVGRCGRKREESIFFLFAKFFFTFFSALNSPHNFSLLVPGQLEIGRNIYVQVFFCPSFSSFQPDCLTAAVVAALLVGPNFKQAR